MIFSVCKYGFGTSRFQICESFDKFCFHLVFAPNIFDFCASLCDAGTRKLYTRPRYINTHIIPGLPHTHTSRKKYHLFKMADKWPIFISSFRFCQKQNKSRQDKTRQDKTRQDKTRQDKTKQTKINKLYNNNSSYFIL